MYRKFGIVLVLFSLLTLLPIVGAVRVAVFVDIPDQDTFTKCLSVDSDTNGYEILEKTGLDIEWSTPGPWGHALCSIEGIGCPSSNCFFCDASAGGTIYWNFYIKESEKDSWSYSPVGFDGGTSCSEHYCAKEGDALGFAYGPYGTKPGSYSFNDICPSKKGERGIEEFDISITPKELSVGKEIRIMIKDENTDRPIKDAEVDIFNIKTSKKVFSGKTNKEGKVSFIPEEEGDYKMRINVRGYNPPQEYVNFRVNPEDTTSIVTTSTTTITIPESTTTVEITTSTTTSTSTTSSTTSTTTSSTTTTIIPKRVGVIGRVIAFSVENPFLILVLIILTLITYSVYDSYKKRK